MFSPPRHTLLAYASIETLVSEAQIDAGPQSSEGGGPWRPDWHDACSSPLKRNDVIGHRFVRRIVGAALLDAARCQPF
jgi:hypothetical protein